MDVLLLTDEPDVASTLPALASVARVVRQAPLAGDPAPKHTPGDVAIIDARGDVARARNACRRLAATAPTVAVVAIVAAEGLVAVDVDWHVDDMVLAAAGAAELRGRLRLAVGHRRRGSAETLRCGDVLLRPASYTATLRGRRLDLTPTEFKLLNYLVRHAGQAISRVRLMDQVWGRECGRRTVDVHVQRLRAKLGDDHQSMVDTVRGVGYMAVSPPEPAPRGVRAS